MLSEMVPLSELQHAEQSVQNLRAEINVMKGMQLPHLKSVMPGAGVFAVLKEDLNLKNEQFDFLYASLKTSAQVNTYTVTHRF
jgi:hypothetical protein